MRIARVIKSITIDYGHRVPHHNSKCRNVHGHRGKVEVTVEGELVIEGAQRSDEGMVMDFGDIKRALIEEIEGKFDHRFLMCMTDPLRGMIHPVLYDESVQHNLLGAVYQVPCFGWVQELPGVPTAENLAFYCYELLSQRLDKPGCVVTTVRFWETETSVAEYNPYEGAEMRKRIEAKRGVSEEESARMRKHFFPQGKA